MRENSLLELRSHQLRNGKIAIDNPFRTRIPEGVTVVSGRNGSGKTTLGTIIEKGRYAYGNAIATGRDGLKVKMITFTDIHSLTGIDVEYYSQRMEATANEFVPTVAELFGSKMSGNHWQRLAENFNVTDIGRKKINFLSSGELRKLLLINALISAPDLLILDSPYIGLDSESREELDNALIALKREGANIMLLLTDPQEIPPYVVYSINDIKY